MKVLHLTFGGQMVEMCDALRKIGIDATACHFRERKFRFKADLCLKLNKYTGPEKNKIRKQFFQQAIKEYDVFHFHYGETFFPDQSDLPILKKLGKKVVMQHRGSDVRTLSVARSFNNPFVRIKQGKAMEEKEISDKLKRLSAYIDDVIVSDHELYPYVSNYYKNVHMIRQAVTLAKFKPLFPSSQQNNPLIIHAPSHTEVKGTEYVLQAVERLKRDGLPFSFLLIDRLDHDQAVELYRKADIIIDQLLIGSFGVFSLEAMALGKPVLCYIRDGMTEKYPPNLPIVNVNPETVYNQLKFLVKNPEKRHQLGLKGWKYVEQYYDSIMIARKLAALYEIL